MRNHWKKFTAVMLVITIIFTALTIHLRHIYNTTHSIAVVFSVTLTTTIAFGAFSFAFAAIFDRIVFHDYYY